MGVKIREKIKGSDVWWGFIHHEGQRVSTRIGSKDAALLWKSEMELDIKKNQFKMPDKDSSPTLTEYFKRFTTGHLKTVKPKTAESYEGSFTKYIEPELGSYHLNELTRSAIKSFVDSLKSKTWKDKE